MTDEKKIPVYLLTTYTARYGPHVSKARGGLVYKLLAIRDGVPEFATWCHDWINSREPGAIPFGIAGLVLTDERPTWLAVEEFARKVLQDHKHIEFMGAVK